ncbi:MAG: AI-2E family transporter [Myxococcota bacterium]
MIHDDETPDRGGEAPPPAAASEEAPEDSGAPPTGEAEEAPRPPIMSVRGWAKFAWALGALAFLAAVVWIALQVPGFTVPFLVAFLIAYLLDPIVDRFEARGVPRAASIGVLLVLFLLVLAGVVFTLGPQIVDQLRQIPAKLAALGEALPGWLEDTFGVQLPETIEATVEQVLGGLDVDEKALLEPAGRIAEWIYGGTTSVVAFVLALTLIPVFAFYLLRDFDDIVARLDGLVPVHLRPAVRARFREIDEVISAFVRGQMLVALVLAVLYAVGLTLVGLPLALVVALVAGVGNLIPYVGTTIGVILATLMALLDWQGWLHLLGVYGVFAVVQFLEGWFITPRVVGESVGLSPLTVIVAILVFGELFGFIGVLIAVPVTAVLLILLRATVDEYRASDFFQDR